MTRRFTGWHMLATMVAFFSVVIGVNVAMATYAETTFGGVVVENSYVASQKFNSWLAAAHSQDKLGWKALSDTDNRIVHVDARSAAAPLAGATVTAVAEHPLGRLPDVDLRFTETKPGHYVASRPLPAGRWRLKLAVTRGRDRADYVQDVTA